MEKTKSDYQSDYIKFLESALESSLSLNKALIDRQPRQLSDDEIMNMSDDYTTSPFSLEFTANSLVAYVKAVIKKASEK